MSVVVDRETLSAETMGFRTVGHVLSHLQRDNRLVVHVLIDGQEPDLGRLNVTRQLPLAGHTLFIETADPRALALEALAEVEAQLGTADRLRDESGQLLQKGQTSKGLERLSGCFSTWQNAEQSVRQTGALLRINLTEIAAGATTLADMLGEFGEQLRQVKAALEQRDFVLLTDILLYEMTQTSARWQEALASMRETIEGLR